ncbi:MAG: hypothetical protein ACO3UU_04695 [Minisyncoccia bacterium]
MNKNYISWIHYAYITITATVLAYVTVMDTPSNSSDESAVNMLPSINEPEPEPEPEPESQNSVMSIFDTSDEAKPIEIQSSEPIEQPPMVIAEPVEQPPIVTPKVMEEPRVEIPKGGNRNKTTIKKQKGKNNKTRNRK